MGVPFDDRSQGPPHPVDVMAVAIWWFRRDLRLSDHPDLDEVRREHDTVHLVAVKDPSVRSVCPRRSAYFDEMLDSLGVATELVVVEGHPPVVVAEEAMRVGADRVFAQEEPTPSGAKRDAAVGDRLEDQGVEFHLSGAPDSVPPGSIRARSGDTYKMFAPFHRAWVALPDARSGEGFPHRLESQAKERLVAYLDELPDLSRGEEHLDGRDRSQLGAAIRLGVIAASHARGWARERDHPQWARQLAWRDFSYECVRRWPELLIRSMRSREWSEDSAALEQWKKGTTGCGPVDAAMRQLTHTGYISNRARMLVASFLTKDLGLDWRHGARWFLRHLLDGDPSVNALNWQWVASTGFDSMPPYRRLSPERQAERFDPDGAWMRRWLTEPPTL